MEKGIAAIKPGAENFLEKQVDLGLLLERVNHAKNKRELILEEKSHGEIKKRIKSKGCQPFRFYHLAIQPRPLLLKELQNIV